MTKCTECIAARGELSAAIKQYGLLSPQAAAAFKAAGIALMRKADRIFTAQIEHVETLKAEGFEEVINGNSKSDGTNP